MSTADAITVVAKIAERKWRRAFPLLGTEVRGEGSVLNTVLLL